MKLTVDIISDKSKQIGVPFHHLLAASLAEQTISRLFSGSFSKNVCLRDKERFSLQNYIKDAPLCIELQYLVREMVSSGILAGKPVDQEVLLAIAEELFPRKDSEYLTWKVKCLDKAIIAVGNLENYEIPLEIRFYESVEGDFFPVEATFEPVVSAKKHSIMLYPVEMRLADDYAEIFEKLELIGDVSVYYDAVNIIRDSFIPGRKFAEYLENSCKKRNVSVNEDRMGSLRSYVNNKYMLKKWKSFKRVQKIEGYEWETVLAIVCFFINPIWKTLSNGEIFFEDWMPELRKFM